MSMIPSIFFDATVALGRKEQNGKTRWFASGFFVGRKENGNNYSVYLITNKHVVNNQKVLEMQFNSKTGIKQYSCNLYTEQQSKCFSEHPTDDVVAISVNINGALAVGAEVSFFELDHHALTMQQMKATGISEGTLVYTLGFPVSLQGNDQCVVNGIYKSPIVRLGCIAKIEDNYHAKGKTEYIIDSTVFPGNSGGPVINRPEIVAITNTPMNTSSNLIGIISRYIAYRETLISTQTGNLRSIAEENSGLSIVIPVDSIIPTVEIERKRALGPEKH